MPDRMNVFLPMRAGSERIHNKNTKSFSGVNGGLCSIKLEQLLQTRCIDDIIVSTNDPSVIAICDSFNSSRVKVVTRPDKLASSSTSTDDLIKYVPQIMPEGHILWTHVTSPFIGPSVYENMINTYFDSISHHDSLMTVTKLQKFIWDDSKPISYDRTEQKWPKTQTISPLWEVNSGAFITKKNVYLEQHDRIGVTPYLYELEENIAFDIDWTADFLIAEAIYKAL